MFAMVNSSCMMCSVRQRPSCMASAEQTYRFAQLVFYKDIHTISSHRPVTGKCSLGCDLLHDHGEVHLHMSNYELSAEAVTVGLKAGKMPVRFNFCLINRS